MPLNISLLVALKRRMLLLYRSLLAARQPIEFVVLHSLQIEYLPSVLLFLSLKNKLKSFTLRHLLHLLVLMRISVYYLATLVNY